MAIRIVGARHVVGVLDLAASVALTIDVEAQAGESRAVG